MVMSPTSITSPGFGGGGGVAALALLPPRRKNLAPTPASATTAMITISLDLPFFLPSASFAMPVLLSGVWCLGFGGSRRRCGRRRGGRGRRRRDPGLGRGLRGGVRQDDDLNPPVGRPPPGRGGGGRRVRLAVPG